MQKKIFFFPVLIFLCFMAISCSSTRKTVTQQHNIQASRLTPEQQSQFDYYFYEALRLKNNMLLDEAMETFLFCRQIDSLDAEVQSQLGVLYVNAGLIEPAMKALKKAVELQPTNWWYSMTLLNIYSQQKNWEEAIALANAVQKIYPQKEEIYSTLAQLYKAAGNIDKAIDAYNQLENLTGIEENISFAKFGLYAQQNKIKKAIAEIDRLIEKYPTENRYKVLRGDIYLQQNNPEQAFAIYEQILKEEPQNPFVYVSLSEYYKKVNQPEKAMEAIVSALKNEQLDVDTKIEILGQYIDNLIKDNEKLDETEALFKLLVDRYPLEEQVHGYYALFLEYRKQIPEAISELETMLNINPKNQQTWIKLIQIYWSEKNFEKVFATTQRAIEVLPEEPMLYFYQGIALYQLNNIQASLQSTQKALLYIKDEQKALKSDVYAQLGDIYSKIGQKDSAFIAYEESLKANPENVYVMNNYAYYLSLEKRDLKKAERMSAKTVEKEPNNATFLDTYAWILYQQGNYSLAKFYIERAIDNLKDEQDNGVIYEHYGDILWMYGGNDEKALEMWKKSYELGNKTEELKQKIENKGFDRQNK
ncbi:MAG: tetratricopeptide repeat protein [Paludibacteraceae bacterium]|nr:tetratricopeptide repeat protein [Paludibacteraceae bacterium]